MKIPLKMKENSIESWLGALEVSIQRMSMTRMRILRWMSSHTRMVKLEINAKRLVWHIPTNQALNSMLDGVDI